MLASSAVNPEITLSKMPMSCSVAFRKNLTWLSGAGHIILAASYFASGPSQTPRRRCSGSSCSGFKRGCSLPQVRHTPFAACSCDEPSLDRFQCHRGEGAVKPGAHRCVKIYTRLQEYDGDVAPGHDGTADGSGNRSVLNFVAQGNRPQRFTEPMANAPSLPHTALDAALTATSSLERDRQPVARLRPPTLDRRNKGNPACRICQLKRPVART